MTAKEKINKIKALFTSEEEVKKVELMQMPLKDNEAVLEAESFEAGQEVSIVNEDERIPLPMGKYEMNDGQVLVVEEEGIIASIGAAQEEEEVEEEAEVAASDKTSETPLPKSVIESQVRETKFSADERENLKTELKAEILAELSIQKEEVEKEEVKEEEKEEVELSKPIKHNPENKTERAKVNFSKNDATKTTKGMIYSILSK